MHEDCWKNAEDKIFVLPRIFHIFKLWIWFLCLIFIFHFQLNHCLWYLGDLPIHKFVCFRSGKDKDLGNGSMDKLMASLFNLKLLPFASYGFFLVPLRRGRLFAGSLSLSIHAYACKHMNNIHLKQDLSLKRQLKTGGLSCTCILPPPTEIMTAILLNT